MQIYINVAADGRLLFMLIPCWFLSRLNLLMVESSRLLLHIYQKQVDTWLHRVRAVLVFAVFGSLTGILSILPSIGSL